MTSPDTQHIQRIQNQALRLDADGKKDLLELLDEEGVLSTTVQEYLENEQKWVRLIHNLIEACQESDEEFNLETANLVDILEILLSEEEELTPEELAQIEAAQTAADEGKQDAAAAAHQTVESTAKELVLEPEVPEEFAEIAQAFEAAVAGAKLIFDQITETVTVRSTETNQSLIFNNTNIANLAKLVTETGQTIVLDCPTKFDFNSTNILPADLVFKQKVTFDANLAIPTPTFQAECVINNNITIFNPTLSANSSIRVTNGRTTIYLAGKLYTLHSNTYSVNAEGIFDPQLEYLDLSPDDAEFLCITINNPNVTQEQVNQKCSQLEHENLTNLLQFRHPNDDQRSGLLMLAIEAIKKDKLTVENKQIFFGSGGLIQRYLFSGSRDRVFLLKLIYEISKKEGFVDSNNVFELLQTLTDSRVSFSHRTEAALQLLLGPSLADVERISNKNLQAIVSIVNSLNHQNSLESLINRNNPNLDLAHWLVELKKTLDSQSINYNSIQSLFDTAERELSKIQIGDQRFFFNNGMLNLDRLDPIPPNLSEILAGLGGLTDISLEQITSVQNFPDLSTIRTLKNVSIKPIAGLIASNKLPRGVNIFFINIPAISQKDAVVALEQGINIYSFGKLVDLQKIIEEECLKEYQTEPGNRDAISLKLLPALTESLITKLLELRDIQQSKKLFLPNLSSLDHLDDLLKRLRNITWVRIDKISFEALTQAQAQELVAAIDNRTGFEGIVFTEGKKTLAELRAKASLETAETDPNPELSTLTAAINEFESAFPGFTIKQTEGGCEIVGDAKLIIETLQQAQLLQKLIDQVQEGQKLAVKCDISLEAGTIEGKDILVFDGTTYICGSTTVNNSAFNGGTGILNLCIVNNSTFNGIPSIYDSATVNNSTFNGITNIYNSATVNEPTLNYKINIWGSAKVIRPIVINKTEIIIAGKGDTLTSCTVDIPQANGTFNRYTFGSKQTPLQLEIILTLYSNGQIPPETLTILKQLEIEGKVTIETVNKEGGVTDKLETTPNEALADTIKSEFEAGQTVTFEDVGQVTLTQLIRNGAYSSVWLVKDSTDQNKVLKIANKKEDSSFEKANQLLQDEHKVLLWLNQDSRTTTLAPKVFGIRPLSTEEKDSPQMVLMEYIDGLANGLGLLRANPKDLLQKLITVTIVLAEKGYVNKDYNLNKDTWEIKQSQTVFMDWNVVYDSKTAGKVTTENESYNPLAVYLRSLLGQKIAQILSLNSENSNWLKVLLNKHFWTPDEINEFPTKLDQILLELEIKIFNDEAAKRSTNITLVKTDNGYAINLINPDLKATSENRLVNICDSSLSELQKIVDLIPDNQELFVNCEVMLTNRAFDGKDKVVFNGNVSAYGSVCRSRFTKSVSVLAGANLDLSCSFDSSATLMIYSIKPYHLLNSATVHIPQANGNFTRYIFGSETEPLELTTSLLLYPFYIGGKIDYNELATLEELKKQGNVTIQTVDASGNVVEEPITFDVPPATAPVFESAPAPVFAVSAEGLPIPEANLTGISSWIKGRENTRISKILALLIHKLPESAQWTDFNIVGDGTLVNVYRATRPDGKKVAIKVPKNSKPISSEHQILTRVNTVLRDTQYIRTPETFGEYNVQLDTGEIKLTVQEFVEGRSLQTDSLEDLEDITKANMATEFVNILQYLMQKGILNADIKPESIVYDPATKKLVILDWNKVKQEEENKPIELKGWDFYFALNPIIAILGRRLIGGAPVNKGDGEMTDWDIPSSLLNTYQKIGIRQTQATGVGAALLIEFPEDHIKKFQELTIEDIQYLIDLNDPKIALAARLDGLTHGPIDSFEKLQEALEAYQQAINPLEAKPVEMTPTEVVQKFARLTAKISELLSQSSPDQAELKRLKEELESLPEDKLPDAIKTSKNNLLTTIAQILK